MTRQNYLQNELNKLISRHGYKRFREHIYDIHLPKWFCDPGDYYKPGYAEPHCIPMSDEHGDVEGICVQHPYKYNGDIFTHSEYFRLSI